MDLLLILLLAGHLIAMNVASGGPLVGAWLEWKSRGGRDTLAASCADFLARWSLIALLGGSAVGVLLGALLWTDSYRQLWVERLGHKLYWGVLELATSLVAMAGYWLWRWLRPGAGAATAVARISVLLFASTNLLYHFPPLFVIASRLSDAGATAGQPITPAMFRQEMARQDVPAMATHFALASLAMTGVLLLGLALRRQRLGGSDEDYARLSLWGGRIAFGASLAQLPVGLWVLTALSVSAQSRLMGSHVAATSCFVIGLFAALWLLRELAAIALGEHERSQLLRAMILATAVVVLMTAGQQLARQHQAGSQTAAAGWAVATTPRRLVD